MARSLSTTVTEAYNDMRLDSFLYESGLYDCLLYTSDAADD